MCTKLFSLIVHIVHLQIENGFNEKNLIIAHDIKYKSHTMKSIFYVRNWLCQHLTNFVCEYRSRKCYFWSNLISNVALFSLDGTFSIKAHILESKLINFALIRQPRCNTFDDINSIDFLVIMKFKFSIENNLVHHDLRVMWMDVFWIANWLLRLL